MAWPAVTLLLVPLIVFSFEGETRGLFSRITKVSVQGNYVDFSPVYHSEPITVSEEDWKPTDGTGFAIPDDQPPSAEDYIEANPHLAVLQSWRNLERLAFQLLPLVVGPTGENPTLTELFQLAIQKKGNYKERGAGPLSIGTSDRINRDVCPDEPYIAPQRSFVIC